MKGSKTIFILILAISTAQMGFSQVKDDAFFGPTDPVRSVQIFPNPATEYLTIKFETPTAKKSKITIHNIIGNEMELEPEIIDDFEVRIRVKDIHEGYYFLAVQNAQSGSKTSYKFLKR